MFVPPDLEFYPRLLREGPLRQTLRDIVKASQGARPRDRARSYALLTKYKLKRRVLMEKVLAHHGVAWCDQCELLVVAGLVQTVLRHGTYTYMDTDCSYGAPFPAEATVYEVKALCGLHSEVHDRNERIRLTPAVLRNGRLVATYDGETHDVTREDKRRDPSDSELERLMLDRIVAEAVPPPVEVTHDGTVQMLGNPYARMEYLA